MSIEETLSQPESKTLEFKRDLTSPQPILKTLVSFANTAGGRLVIGITDDKQRVGVEHPLDEKERLSSLIADSISPRLVPNIELITVEDKTLLIVEVFLSNSRPHYLNREGMEQGVYVRLGSSNRQADQALIGELRRSVEGIAFDEMPMPELTVDDLDLTAAQEAFGDRRQLDEKSLLTLKLLTQHQNRCVPTHGGTLLPGLTIEEMKQGISRIRNHVIARVFREINLIEQWGTGVRRIFSEAKELGLAEPKIEEIGMRVRFTVYLAVCSGIDWWHRPHEV